MDTPDIARETFFVRRPVLSTVLSLIITLVGVLSLRALPVEQYPNLVPPQVQVYANYPGASAQVIAQTVAAPLEQQLNGVDDMIYMQSTSSGSGEMMLNVYFNVGTDPDQAAINVNNRVQIALSQLPEEVRRFGVTVLKKSPAILQIVTLSSPGGRYDMLYLSNYAGIYVADELKRLQGVGDVQVFGSREYSMRVWLRPDRLAALNLSPADVSNAIKEQNAQYAAGRIGEEPLRNPVSITWQINTQGRLETPEAFGNIIVRSSDDGSALRLRDVATIELGGKDYSFASSLNGKPAQAIGIFLTPGANALETAQRVRSTMGRLAANFPVDVAYDIPYDTTVFVGESIKEVVHTLLEAMLLVFCVVFLFLQNWRATLIPCLAVPVSILGTFAGMHVLGFSVNTLTLFGLVLAIGIVVDDAIVVLENVERIMRTRKLSARRATAVAMNEVTGPIIAIVLVLCAVFIPVAFLGGLAGQMYKQFAITIAVSVTISGIVALSFTPALCVLLLKTAPERKRGFFALFNQFFERLTGAYVGIAERLMRFALITGALFALVAFGSWKLMGHVPGGLVPDEDQGYILGLAIMPEGSSLSRTTALTRKLDEVMRHDGTTANVITMTGLDILSSVAKTSAATTFVTMKPWHDRNKPEESAAALARRLMGAGLHMPEGLVLGFTPPPISGMSNTGGFEGYIQGREGQSPQQLAEVAQRIVQAAAKRPELASVSSSLNVNAPQLYVELDRERARALGVSVADVFTTMASTFGVEYVNDFNIFGRTFKVRMQVDGEYRSHTESINEIYVRNKRGDMAPLNALVTVERVSGPQILDRFNGFPAARLQGGPAPGHSSGQALAAMEEVMARELPSGYTLAWSGQAYQEFATSSDSALVFALAIVLVFFILAAQYESWSLPLAVITAVPFGVLGALTATWLRGYANDVYFQVALITLVGLSAKNAILIVEFAVEKYREGMSFAEAGLEAARLRFRPVVMTSLAFILGCLPLAVSSGAGAASRHAVGTAVIGGMLAATVLAPLFVPFFFRHISAAAYRLFPDRKEEDPA